MPTKAGQQHAGITKRTKGTYSICLQTFSDKLRKLHQSLGGEKPCIAVENLQATISRESVSRNKR